MEKIKEILRKLNVIDNIYQAFDMNNIEINNENLKRAGFGFHKITDSIESTIVLTETVSLFIDKIRNLQHSEDFEQPFALLGIMQLDDKGNPLILFDKFIEEKNLSKNRYSSNLSESMIENINKYLSSAEIPNKVLLLGHTHPIVDFKKQIIPKNKKEVINALFSLKNNPLKLRDNGLNISVSDINQLVQVQENIGRNTMVLQGIVLQNGELNIMFYDGSTIKSLDNVFVYQNNNLSPKQNFRTEGMETIVKK